MRCLCVTAMLTAMLTADCVLLLCRLDVTGGHAFSKVTTESHDWLIS